MLTEKDIYIEDYEVDFDDLTKLDFQFECNYNLFGIKVADEEWANFYMDIDPFTNEVEVVYDLSEEDYSKEHKLDLTENDKKVLRNCAEKYMQQEDHMTITEFCEMMIQEYGGK